MRKANTLSQAVFFLVVLYVCAYLGLRGFVAKTGLFKQKVQTASVVFSSMKCENKLCSDLERQIERNCEMSFKNLNPGAIEFVRIPSFVIRHNKYGLPELHSLFQYVYELYPRASTYTYVNSDLMADKSFHQTIKLVSENLKGKEFVMIGARTDVLWNENWSWATDFDFASIFKSGTIARLDAIDYFVTTRNAIRWQDVPPFVIGRPAFDNWLVNYAAQSPNVILIDVSKTLKMLHQSRKAGLDHWESMSMVDDRDFNRRMGRGGYHTGYINIARCYTKHSFFYMRLAGYCKASML